MALFNIKSFGQNLNIPWGPILYKFIIKNNSRLKKTLFSLDIYPNFHSEINLVNVVGLLPYELVALIFWFGVAINEFERALDHDIRFLAKAFLLLPNPSTHHEFKLVMSWHRLPSLGTSIGKARAPKTCTRTLFPGSRAMQSLCWLFHTSSASCRKQAHFIPQILQMGQQDSGRNISPSQAEPP